MCGNGFKRRIKRSDQILPLHPAHIARGRCRPGYRESIHHNHTLDKTPLFSPALFYIHKQHDRMLVVEQNLLFVNSLATVFIVN